MFSSLQMSRSAFFSPCTSREDSAHSNGDVEIMARKNVNFPTSESYVIFGVNKGELSKKWRKPIKLSSVMNDTIFKKLFYKNNVL